MSNAAGNLGDNAHARACVSWSKLWPILIGPTTALRLVSPSTMHAFVCVLRHAHGSHAIERGASLPEVQATLGHGNIATTSGYLHARPDSSSGLHLDPGVFLR